MLTLNLVGVKHSISKDYTVFLLRYLKNGDTFNERGNRSTDYIKEQDNYFVL